MTDIKFNCEFCNQSLEAPSEMAAQSIDCPSCGKPIEIPPIKQPPPLPPTSKHCPFCDELILAEAKKCKHCGEFLELVPRHKKAVSAPSPASAIQTQGLGIFFVVVAGIALLVGFINMSESRAEKSTREWARAASIHKSTTRTIERAMSNFGGSIDPKYQENAEDAEDAAERSASQYKEMRNSRHKTVMLSFIIGGALGVTGLILVSSSKK